MLFAYYLTLHYETIEIHIRVIDNYYTVMTFPLICPLSGIENNINTTYLNWHTITVWIKPSLQVDLDVWAHSVINLSFILQPEDYGSRIWVYSTQNVLRQLRMVLPNLCNQSLCSLVWYNNKNDSSLLKLRIPSESSIAFTVWSISATCLFLRKF